MFPNEINFLKNVTIQNVAAYSENQRENQLTELISHIKPTQHFDTLTA